ncbi:spermidine synthase [Cohnella boryungensis]|uniref:Spermidine synthase n=1 Tax=Cohnella boryungensis TaxID=768479 RepID=A0ABV8SD55_9BACL
MHPLVKETSPFNEITVYETSHFAGCEGKFRCLRFADEDVQGAMDLKDRDRVLLGYQKALIGLMEHGNPMFERAFLIGHGIGTISRHFSHKKIRAAEVDAAVVEISRKYFDYRLNNVLVGDGRQLLEEEPSKEFDYILLDAFTSKGTPVHLTSEEFFALTSDKLRPGGTLLLNVMGRPRNDRFIAALATTLKRTYDSVQAYSMPTERDSDSRNILFAAGEEPLRQGLPDGLGLREFVPEEGHLIRDSIR